MQTLIFDSCSFHNIRHPFNASIKADIITCLTTVENLSVTHPIFCSLVARSASAVSATDVVITAAPWDLDAKLQDTPDIPTSVSAKGKKIKKIYGQLFLQLASLCSFLYFIQNLLNTSSTEIITFNIVDVYLTVV